MRRTLALVAIALMGAVGLSLAAPIATVTGPEIAAAQKPGGSGGGSASKAGENAADLISSLVGPVLIVLVGVFALLAFSQRSIGMAVTAVIVGLFGGLFIIEPDSAETLFKDIYRSIF